jgi:Glycine-zipper domain
VKPLEISGLPLRYSIAADLETPMSRFSILFLITLTSIGVTHAGKTQALANPLYAQYYAPGYGYPPQGYRPPCEAVTPGPFQGAARGAAGGALIGAISGNAGRGAAIGAGFGAVRNAVRRGSARSYGACY